MTEISVLVVGGDVWRGNPPAFPSHRIRYAHTIDDAVEAFSTFGPSLIVLDLDLEGSLQALKSIKGLPGLGSVPLIAVSDNPDSDKVAAAAEAGVGLLPAGKAALALNGLIKQLATGHRAEDAS